MECVRVRGLLQEYMEGWLPEAASAEVEGHLGGCERCAAALAQWQSLDRALWRQPRHDPPRGFAEAVMERIGSEEPARVPWRERWVPMALAAAAALLLLASGSLVDWSGAAWQGQLAGGKTLVERGTGLAAWAGDAAEEAARAAADHGAIPDSWATTTASAVGLPPEAFTWVGLGGLLVMLILLRPYWMGQKTLETGVEYRA